MSKRLVNKFTWHKRFKDLWKCLLPKCLSSPFCLEVVISKYPRPPFKVIKHYQKITGSAVSWQLLASFCWLGPPLKGRNFCISLHCYNNYMQFTWEIRCEVLTMCEYRHWVLHLPALIIPCGSCSFVTPAGCIGDGALNEGTIFHSL